jgi:hypothetical protein
MLKIIIASERIIKKQYKQKRMGLLTDVAINEIRKHLGIQDAKVTDERVDT